MGSCQISYLSAFTNLKQRQLLTLVYEFTRDITVPIQMITRYGKELSNFQMFKDEHTQQNFLSHYVKKLSFCTSKY